MYFLRKSRIHIFIEKGGILVITSLNLEEKGLILMFSILPWKKGVHFGWKVSVLPKKQGFILDWKVSVLSWKRSHLELRSQCFATKRRSFSNWRTRMGTTFSSEWGSRGLRLTFVAFCCFPTTILIQDRFNNYMMHPPHIAECYKCNCSVCKWWGLCRWVQFIILRLILYQNCGGRLSFCSFTSPFTLNHSLCPYISMIINKDSTIMFNDVGVEYRPWTVSVKIWRPPSPELNRHDHTDLTQR